MRAPIVIFSSATVVLLFLVLKDFVCGNVRVYKGLNAVWRLECVFFGKRGVRRLWYDVCTGVVDVKEQLELRQPLERLNPRNKASNILCCLLG